MFNPAQVKTFVKQVKAEAGTGWDLLGPRLQQALIAEKALKVLRQQVADVVSIESVTGLFADMMAEAGLVG